MAKTEAELASAKQIAADQKTAKKVVAVKAAAGKKAAAKKVAVDKKAALAAKHPKKAAKKAKVKASTFSLDGVLTAMRLDLDDLDVAVDAASAAMPNDANGKQAPLTDLQYRAIAERWFQQAHVDGFLDMLKEYVVDKNA